MLDVYKWTIIQCLSQQPKLFMIWSIYHVYYNFSIICCLPQLTAKTFRYLVHAGYLL